MAAATSLLALVRGFIGLLTLEPAGGVAGDDIIYADFVCDDRGRWYDEDGYYREDCTRDGCGLNDETCYFGDYFERCLDAAGQPTTHCAQETTTCSGVIGCLGLWIDCGGEYHCKMPNGILGCKQGSCVEEG